MKAFLSIALLSLAGCSHSCKDGGNLAYGWAAAMTYSECGRECCRAQKPKKCKCSDRCTCNHGAAKPE